MGGSIHQHSTTLLIFFLLSQPCLSSIQTTSISPGFEVTQMRYVDNDGLFLHSNNSDFFFGFKTLAGNVTAFLLVVVYQPSSRTVWTANRGSPVSNSDKFVFGDDGNARLESGGHVVWSTKTGGSGAATMELLDNGNLVLLAGKGSSAPVWQSFDNPTDTLLPGQAFRDGMSLISDVGAYNLSYSLKISAGDMKLQADFRTPQPYWSFSADRRMIQDDGGNRGIFSGTISNNSWNFYDKKNSLISRFLITNSAGDGAKWAAVLGKDGFVRFVVLGGNRQGKDVIPSGGCDTPDPCGPYYMCSGNVRCNCPAVISSRGSCKPDIGSPCGGTANELVEVKQHVGYFAVGFQPAAAKESNLTSCKNLCANNCSCLALFFDQSSGDCHLFDEIGSLRESTAKNYTCFLKISSSSGGRNGEQDGGGGGGKKHLAVIVSMSVLTVAIVAAMLYIAVMFYKRRVTLPEPAQPLVSSDDDDNFLETMSGMPVRISYRELQEATNNFSEKLGQGGFGSVYLGKLPDGTRIAVKKLEGIGQGRKEFRAEVSIIGSIHHVHLARLRGFCAESTHRLLAYEFMAKGSLDKWIFRNNREDFLLDWDKRFNIALGTAKGLAYLHQDCDSKIVHCDIKPENVLLDDNFLAKVSDFGLAKLMTREQSHVFTTLRGTRGYLAPEWIISSSISEKSDVYSFGMVLLEIIGGRKNFDPSMSSEKAHFPSYAFKKMEEGKLKEVLDGSLHSGDKDERVEIAIKVALWCIQEDMSLRPSMTKVVQMLEGVADVPQPPTSGHMGYRLYANLFKTISQEEGSSSCGAPSSGCNSDAFLSAVRLSGPR